ncbi:2-dehydropantoate 2-reductase [Photobacterium damselae]|uniref:2-dehydropantoate 2-reductase n=1 Tax=Photobacterium damselae TaxID=38293 RepID=UPI00406950F9
MKITIVGAGAIGSLWGYQLSQHHLVQMWTRTDEPHHSLTFKPHDVSKSSQRLHLPANNREWLRQSDLVLVTVKAFQVIDALRPIYQDIKPTSLVVIMHNGMGTQHSVTQLLPHHTIAYATTAQAAFKQHDIVTHTGIGQTWLGLLQGEQQQVADWAQQFHHILPPCHCHPNILEPLWLKLAINCSINPLTAIYQCTNGQLDSAEHQQQITAICHEVAQVMSQEVAPITTEELLTRVNQVILATQANYSSMNRDVFHHRTTEIDYITGYLIETARCHHIASPYNEKLWQQIKQLEHHYHD